MGKKKVIGGTSNASLSFELQPFCYYCDREFDSVKTLIQHQRTKHLACGECGQKFDTVTGLRVHMLNAYKKTMKEVPNALPGRASPDIVVHGMEGIPRSIIEEKTKKAIGERAEREKARVEKLGSERPAVPPEPQPAASGDSGGRRASAPLPPAEDRTAPSHPSAKPPNAPKPPVDDKSASSKKRPAEAPVTAAPVPTRPRTTIQPPKLHLAPSLTLRPPPQLPAATAQGMMSGVSLAVQKLLAGGPGPFAGDDAVAVHGLPGRTVSGTLSGLHPVALQVLAAAGVLPSGRVVSNMPHAFVDNTSILAPAAFPPLGFPTAGFGGPLGGTFPPGMLSGTMGALSSQLTVGSLGLESKQPSLDCPGLVMPVDA